MFRKFFRKRHENVLWNDQVVLAHILKSKKKIDCEICHHLTLFQSKSLEKKVGRRLAIMLRVPQKMCNFCKSCCAYFYKGYQSNFAKQSINKLPKGRFFLKKNEANSKIICVLDFSIFRALYVMNDDIADILIIQFRNFFQCAYKYLKSYLDEKFTCKYMICS